MRVRNAVRDGVGVSRMVSMWVTWLTEGSSSPDDPERGLPCGGPAGGRL